MAISIGSSGSAALANMLVSITALNASSTALPALAAAVAPDGIQYSATAIMFSVNVPVLSVHNTVADPNVSIAEARRVSTPAWPMRHAPIARNIVSTTGNSSGNSDMPMAIPASSASIQPPRSNP